MGQVEPSWRIEYHPPCTYYKDGGHRERSGYYLCECKASNAWHKKILDTRLQDIADVWNDPAKPLTRASLRDGGMPRLTALLDALTEEVETDIVPREKRFDHGKRDHDELVEFGLLDEGQPTEYATYQARVDDLTKEAHHRT